MKFLKCKTDEEVEQVGISMVVEINHGDLTRMEYRYCLTILLCQPHMLQMFVQEL